MLVEDVIRKGVAFLGYHSRNTGKFRWGGTAFFISVDELDGSGIKTIYAVTAKHVIEGIRDKSVDGIVVVGANRQSPPPVKGYTETSGRFEIKIPCAEWTLHPDDKSVDVAVTPFNAHLPHISNIYLSTRGFADAKRIAEEKVGIGNETFTIGLFRNHPGIDKNIPIVRVGNISAMPEERVNASIGMIQAYLVEARSIGGLSGSPVYVVMERTRGNGPLGFLLLGLVHGHFRLPRAGEDSIIDEVESDDMEPGISLNVGICIVVPAAMILEVLNHPNLVTERENLVKAHWKERAGVPDAATDLEN